jgi:hypothetical protein
MKSFLIILVVLSCALSLVEAQSNPHYTMKDPAIRQMEMSMNMQGTPMITDPAIREMLISMNMPQYAGNVPAETIAGNWQLNLSDGTNIDLTLQKSGLALFGKERLPQALFLRGLMLADLSEMACVWKLCRKVARDFI